MSHSPRLPRRRFLQSAAAVVAVPYVIPSSALGLAGNEAPSNRVAIGCVGVGDRGFLNMTQLMRYGAQITALCDVRPEQRQRAQEVTKLPASAVHNDFRDLVARKDVDAVMCATPDHWHVLIAIAAIKAGKDLYLEKPMGKSIAEGIALRKVLKEHPGRVFMHGTEQRGMPEVRKVCELVRNGRIGKLQRVLVGCPGGRKIGNPPEMPVPPGLDYDLWLGPAPKKPYTAKRVLPPTHHWISDYSSSGYICGWGIHHLDVAQWGMNADDTGPVEMEGWATYPPPGDLADTALDWEITYTYADGVKIIFKHGSRHPQGVRFEGSDGWIFKAYREPAQASDPLMLESVIAPSEVHLYQTDCDDHCFVECVKSRKETCSPFEAGHRSSTLGYLGDIACRMNRKLQWDPVKECFKNDPEADKLLACEMRAPWCL
jgi:predicted dehydrogenase